MGDRQYGTTSNLSARSALHHRFSTNPEGWFPWVLRNLRLGKNSRILELGCGTGALWRQAGSIQAGWHLVLTDVSDAMLEACRKDLGTVPQIEAIMLADAQDIPYGDGVFDAVIANHMLYHVPDLPVALQEIARVLKPDGILYASTVGEGNMRQFHELLLACAPGASSYLEHSQIIDRFSLENGSALLRQWFPHAELVTYEDSLDVTEVDPLVAYAQSLGTGTRPVLHGQFLHRFERLAKERIEKDGSFHIDKEAGMFIAQKAGKTHSCSRAGHG